jgi:hypothetical protein
MSCPDYMAKQLVPRNDDGMFSDPIRLLNRFGNANWRAFQLLDFGLDRIFSAAAVWKTRLEGIEYPWLVWSMDDDWCYLQQQLVRLVGWTPVVGYDPRAGVPKKMLPGAVLIDFNADLNLPILWMHFPIDFIFLFAPRLAFWHADLFCSRDNMEYLAQLFRSLKDDEIAITRPTGGRLGGKLGNSRLVNTLTFWRPDRRRFWELAGCITAGASRHMFDHGCSIWQGWAFHPNCPDAKEFNRRFARYWDSGAGVLYWHERYRRPVKIIPEAQLVEGHFSPIGNKNYRKRFRAVSPDTETLNGGDNLRANITAVQAARELGILELFDAF